LLALCVRLPQLGSRPMHTDETVNAYIVGQVLAGHPYQYDSRDRHGPVLSEIAVPLARLQGAHDLASLTERELRLAPALGGSLMILLFGLGVECFGFTACVTAALLFAFAPLPLYYSRYFIHETFFVAGTLGLLLSLLWRRSVAAAVFTGLSAAFLLATKETAVIHFFAFGVALGVCHWLQPAKKIPGELSRQRFWMMAGTVFILAGGLLFTWGGRDGRALTNLAHAAPHLAARAGGEGHAKPFWYFAGLLAGGGSGFLLLVLAGLGLNRQFSGGRLSRPWLFLAVYGVVIAVIYSAIPYKTPWLALNGWLPIAWFVGAGGEAVWSRFPATSLRGLFWVAVVGVVILVGRDSWQRVFRDPAGETNPYAYAHTTEDVLGLPGRIAQVAQARQLTNPRLAVIAADAWPLPWYLRQFAQTGFWQPGQDPGAADFYLTTTQVPDNLKGRLQGFTPEYYGVRPNVLLLLWTPAGSPPPP